MLPWTNASLHQPPLYARRKPPARSAVVPLEEARSSSLGWEARAKAQRIVTSSSSVRVGAAVPPKSGCLRYWKACGRVSQLRCIEFLKKTSRPSFARTGLVLCTLMFPPYGVAGPTKSSPPWYISFSFGYIFLPFQEKRKKKEAAATRPLLYFPSSGVMLKSHT